MKAFLLLLTSLVALSGISQEEKEKPALKDLNGFFPFEVPETLEEWETRAEKLRLQVKVANGLWPMPERTPLNAVVHGKIERDGFTIEKVYFESIPGLHVTGLLFRPANAKPGEKLPAVLSPHGHGGRLYDLGEEGIKKHLESGGEKFPESGRYPKVARCVTLARLGCVTFLYDMIGYADNQQLSRELGHGFKTQRPDFEGKESWGLYSAQSEMRLQSIFGIQTWNSVRALDFLEALPDVDPERIAVTGGSGGGTQSIMLCAIDPRPIASFPNGMVSSSMQGGCTCENASLLRIGTGNVELTALYAPKPQAMTAANDWTKEMLVEGKGFPELKQLYTMYGKAENVQCSDLLKFPHNYNFVTRDLMYHWFNKHMNLGLSDDEVVERDFKPLTAEEHAVYDDDAHPKPEGGDAFERKITKWLADTSDRQLASMEKPEAKKVVRAAWRTMIGKPTERTKAKTSIAEPNGDCDKVIIWVDGKVGRDVIGSPAAEAASESKSTQLVGADLFMAGITETPTVSNKREFAGYTHGYNHSVFARRVHAVLGLVRQAKRDHPDAAIELVGTKGAEPVVVAAGVIAVKSISSVTIDDDSFRFADITSYRDPNFIPGAVKYGDFPGLLDLLPKKKLKMME